MSRVKTSIYPWPYNLAYTIFESEDFLSSLLPYNLVNTVSEELSEREATVVVKRFKEFKKYEDIGSDLNVSKERIRQILATAIRKLRQQSRVRTYLGVTKAFWEETNRQLKDKELQIAALKQIINEDERLSIKMERMDNKNELFSKPIADLELSVRSYNCLVRSNVLTIGDFHKMDLYALMRIRNLGRKSFQEILSKLGPLGFKVEKDNKTYDLSAIPPNDTYIGYRLVWEGADDGND